MRPRLILATESRPKQHVLRERGVDFIAAAADIDEEAIQAATVAETVMRRAVAKAQVVAKLYPRDIVVGADTMGEFQGQALGKPTDEGEATKMLHMLSGGTHDSYTGLAVIQAGENKEVARLVTGQVTFRDLSAEEIEAYVVSGEPMGKAGAYAIQGEAKNFVTKLEGDPTSLMGLPFTDLAQILSTEFQYQLA